MLSGSNLGICGTTSHGTDENSCNIFWIFHSREKSKRICNICAGLSSRSFEAGGARHPASHPLSALGLKDKWPVLKMHFDPRLLGQVSWPMRQRALNLLRNTWPEKINHSRVVAPGQRWISKGYVESALHSSGPSFSWSCRLPSSELLLWRKFHELSYNRPFPEFRVATLITIII